MDLKETTPCENIFSTNASLLVLPKPLLCFQELEENERVIFNNLY